MGPAIETKTAAEVANGPNDGITMDIMLPRPSGYIAPHGAAVIALLYIKKLQPYCLHKHSSYHGTCSTGNTTTS